jgi:hypothetical protein
MPTLLRIDNFPQTNIKEPTQVAQDTAAGVTSITVLSASGFSANDIVFAGTPALETIERLIIQSVAGQVITFTAPTVFKHLQFEPFNSVKGDKLKIYTAPNIDGSLPLDTSFTVLGSPISIDPDTSYTEYSDTVGDVQTWYKYTFYNATSAYESSLGDSIGTRGGGYGHYCSIDEIRQNAGFKSNPNITDAVIDIKRNQAEAEINGELYQVYALPFAQPIPWKINQIASTLAAGYLLSDEYGTMSRGLSKDGDAMVKEAQEMLMMVKIRETVITNAAGVSLVISQTVSSYPNNSTDTVTDAPRRFTSGYRF